MILFSYYLSTSYPTTLTLILSYAGSDEGRDDMINKIRLDFHREERAWIEMSHMRWPLSRGPTEE